MSWFGKKDETAKITDVIFINKNAKYHACLELAKKDATIMFIAWFEETLYELQTFFKEQANTSNIFLYRQVTTHLTENRKIIFVEHYPLHKKEISLFESLKLKEATIYSSMDEPLFTTFGGEKISALMRSMGMQENEPIQHLLITKALKNAQEKIEKKITIEQSALSQGNWFKRNLQQTSE